MGQPAEGSQSMTLIDVDEANDGQVRPVIQKRCTFPAMFNIECWASRRRKVR